MGELFRRFWLPATVSQELPESDGAPIRLRLLASDAGDDSTERTLLTVRGAEGFTVSVPRLAARPVWVEHLGVLVGRPPADKAGFLSAPAPADKTLYHRVFAEPEQTYARAAREIPQLDRTTQNSNLGVYLPLGVPDHRQELAVRVTSPQGPDYQLVPRSSRTN